ncbi:DNA replication/repair protein RecF [Longirhabdus pacifica]|uniref:DNA replication/repair protein RecF n=1 Tax=Longirhabdus pacifica TaxID=2305227 RepID=UPI001008BC35|nr:DNA replication/repair protein RecF [Longirhabdus pacifica]
MFVKEIKLAHYRNYNQAHIELDPSINLIIGENAQGKTNILESIYVLALTKSHRTHNDKELIQWSHEEAKLSAEIQKKYGPIQLDLSISQKGKKAKVNHLEQKKLSTYIGALNVVLFAPEDLNIVKGSPAIRRRFLNMEIGQVFPTYVHHLYQYQKILTQRNHCLKKIQSSSDEAMLAIWNEQLATEGTKIILKRQQFIKTLESWANQIHFSISNGKEQLRIKYETGLPLEDIKDASMLMEQFMIKLTQMQKQEIKRGMTLVGPHRDDLRFYINDKEANIYGSQGQQRTVALSIKLAEIELIHQEVGEYPILLLDDVLSELDQFRQNQLIDTFNGRLQTIVTTTSADSIDTNKLKASTFEIHDGNVH